MLGKFYLVDAGYGAKPSFLPPFRAVRYHLNEWEDNPVQNEKELFNLKTLCSLCDGRTSIWVPQDEIQNT
jgi:hypothetical protein